MVNRVVTQRGFTDLFDDREVQTLVILGLVVLDSSRKVRNGDNNIVVVNTYRGANDAGKGL